MHSVLPLPENLRSFGATSDVRGATVVSQKLGGKVVCCGVKEGLQVERWHRIILFAPFYMFLLGDLYNSFQEKIGDAFSKPCQFKIVEPLFNGIVCFVNLVDLNSLV